MLLVMACIAQMPTRANGEYLYYYLFLAQILLPPPKLAVTLFEIDITLVILKGSSLDQQHQYQLLPGTC